MKGPPIYSSKLFSKCSKGIENKVGLFLCGILFLASPLLGYASHPQFLKLNPSQNRALCQLDDASKAPMFLWNQGIYQAVAHLEFYEKNSMYREPQIREFLQIKALERNHKGIYYGVCKDKFFALSVKSATQIRLTASEIYLPLKALHHQCRELRVHKAYIGFGRGMRQKLASVYPNKSEGEKQVLSISCLFRKAVNNGFELLFLIPLGGLQYSKALLPNRLQLQSEGWLEWLNMQRAHLNLTALRVNPKVYQYHKALPLVEIQHSRRNLDWLGKNLASLDLQYIGENKAAGMNSEKWMELWWFSPRHRNLILDRQAQFISLKQAQWGKSKLASLIFAANRSRKNGVKR